MISRSSTQSEEPAVEQTLVSESFREFKTGRYALARAKDLLFRIPPMRYKLTPEIARFGAVNRHVLGYNDCKTLINRLHQRMCSGWMQRSRLEKEPIVQITVSSRHMDVSPALKSYAEQKTEKLLKYYDRIQEIEVVFDAGKARTSVEVIIHADHKNMFVAHHDEGDAYACLDATVDKLERQLSEHKKKVRNRKHAAEDKHTLQ